ncbi:hypothetical protein DEU56DRAFT_760234 [Suillus clintonianus]|uniref:uncharacterized protein n=1 Tax=Suillus clintonianus TaxID=1904413 RepID=UPI001B865F84|nr:uncharacterized protein DEU56DRAFT_760234 [Suillus clintonianus]KAG2122777.1 hypothetical protein DEU56DRAFT_760234 [Suillus clintonianus]
MPSVINFDAFRLRWRSKSFAKPLSPPNEDDSDRSSSPERVERRISFHFTTPNNADERPRNLQKTLPELPTGGTSKQSHVELMNEKSSTHFLEQPVEATEKRVGLLRSTTNIHKLSPPTTKPPPDTKPSLIRRVTSKLHITVPASSQPKPSPPHIAHVPTDVKHFSRPPRSPRVILPRSPTLPNSFASRENREAALRERGLLPPKKDLSEQEREADKHLATLPVPDKDQSGSSAASKIKEEWLSINRSCEARASDSGSGTAFYPRQLPSFGALASGVSPLSHSASPSLPQSPTCDSDSTRADLNPEMSFIARSSISSSVPPLSPSSHLEVLEEEPAEHVPPTPPPPPPHYVHPPIVVSTPVEDYFPPGHTALPESPVSCSFSSYLAPPGSSSQPHTSPPVLPDKENSYSPFPAPPSRRRTTESNVRRRSSVGTSLSKFGTNSLTNLRRSIGSVRYSGSSADLSSTSSHLSSPRVSVRPTMHNRGSILLETKGIQDAESRRLSELAFLD